MAFYTEITSVENTIKKLHIQADLHSGYIHNLYHDKQDIIDELFCQYIKPLLKYIYHPAFIKEWIFLMLLIMIKNNSFHPRRKKLVVMIASLTSHPA